MCERTKAEVFENAPLHNKEFTKTERYQLTTTDIFYCVFVIGRISANGEKQMFSLRLCAKMEQCERGGSMEQKRILTNRSSVNGA